MHARSLRRSEKTFIRSNVPPATPPRSWGRYAYLTLLVLIAAYALDWAAERIFYVQGLGFLEARTAIVAARTTGRITRIGCALNDTVGAGTPLVWLDNTDSTAAAGLQPARAAAYTNERRIIDSKRRIDILRQRIARARADLKITEQEAKMVNELLGLNAVKRSQSLETRQKVSAAQLELNELRIELKAEQDMLASYRRQRSLLPLGDNGAAYESVLQAMEPGIISAIYKKPGDVVRAGEEVIKTIDASDTRVRAFFEGRYETQLEPGKKVTVNFENGDSSQGIIRKIYPITSSQPPEIKHRFGKVRRFIVAEIAPGTGQSWNRVQETQVTVFTRRKWF